MPHPAGELFNPNKVFWGLSRPQRVLTVPDGSPLKLDKEEIVKDVKKVGETNVSTETVDRCLFEKVLVTYLWYGGPQPLNNTSERGRLLGSLKTPQNLLER